MAKIITSFIHPPIPIRSHDWIARLNGDCYDEESGPYGNGATEAEAIASLREQLPSCDDCGAITSDDGVSIDPQRICRYCKP